MLRRMPLAKPIAKAMAGRQVRAYTDYAHYKFPVFNEVVVFFTLHLYIVLAVFTTNGAVWKTRNDYKKHLNRRWERLGTGYKWAEDIPQIDHIFVDNLPKSAI